MRPLERTLLKLSALVLVLFVAIAILMPAFACGCKLAGPVACLSNLKQMGLGHVAYASDHDERFPPRDAWADAIQPYAKPTLVFHEPSKAEGAGGYAFNGALSSAKAPPKVETVPLVYDSVNPTRNASDLVTSLPKPGRHRGVNNMAYADGHAKRLRP